MQPMKWTTTIIRKNKFASLTTPLFIEMDSSSLFSFPKYFTILTTFMILKSLYNLGNLASFRILSWFPEEYDELEQIFVFPEHWLVSAELSIKRDTILSIGREQNKSTANQLRKY